MIKVKTISYLSDVMWKGNVIHMIWRHERCNIRCMRYNHKKFN